MNVAPQNDLLAVVDAAADSIGLRPGAGNRHKYRQPNGGKPRQKAQRSTPQPTGWRGATTRMKETPAAFEEPSDPSSNTSSAPHRGIRGVNDNRDLRLELPNPKQVYIRPPAFNLARCQICALPDPLILRV
jgi:hypothetical protein